MPTPTIPAGNLFMNATLFTGTGASLTVTNGSAGQSFQPDFVWLKTRNQSGYGHELFDSVRGVGNYLISNSTNAESNASTSLTAFNSNGFSVGSWGFINGSGDSIVGWQWKAGGTAVSNTSGTITSSVSANTTSGFSVVTYTGIGGLGTVGHGLGVAPSMIILMPRSFTSDKYVYNSSIGAANYMSINLTGASASTTLWNSTSPTSSVFTVNGNGANQNTSTFVAYCWAPIAGYSAFGSYTGNGSTDGPFIYTGFRPKFFLLKRSDTGSAANWEIYDTSRDPYNQSVNRLSPSTSDAESSSYALGDILSNGVKIRQTDQTWNANGGTYIYMAFAENPFKYANAR